MASINSLPDELLAAIVDYTASIDILCCVQLLSRRFHRLSQDATLWLARCRSDFAFWVPPSQARLDAAGRAADRGSRGGGSWKQMWIDRHAADRETAAHFEKVLETKVGRVRHLEAICRRMLDAKEFLLEQYHTADDATDDVLARRYYADMALASIHRGMAAEEWCALREEHNTFRRLDSALGAYDLFVLHDAKEDLGGINSMINDLADTFRAAHADFDTMTTRQKALALVQWVRARDLTGITYPEDNYHNLRNCLIGHALSDPDHPSLPIISCAIYACIAQRLGLRAYCTTMPGHMHVTVIAPAGQTLDGMPVPEASTPARPGPEWPPAGTEPDEVTGVGAAAVTSPTDATTDGASATPRRFISASAFRYPALEASLPDNGERMFLDPYNSAGEVGLAQLRQTVAQTNPPQLGMPSPAAADLPLLPAPTAAMVCRVGLNIESSWKYMSEPRNAGKARQRRVKQLRRGDSDMNAEALIYATMWALALLQPVDTTEDYDQFVDGLLARVGHTYGEDAWIIKRFLLPVYDRYVELRHNGAGFPPESEDDIDPGDGRTDLPVRTGHPFRLPIRDWTDPRIMVRMVYNLDRRRPQVSRRYTQDLRERVRFRIGQVFRHRRYHYVGIINGWAPDKPSSLPTPNNMAESEVEDAHRDVGIAMPRYPLFAPRLYEQQKAAAKREKCVFYTCLVPHAERQVISQANVEPVTDPAEVPKELMFLAGRHFKRFDRETCMFVSNLREFYPDD